MALLFSGWPLLIANVIKLVIIIIGFVGQVLMSGFYSSLESGDGIKVEWVTLEDIIFAGGKDTASKFLDINFFEKVGQTDTIGVFSDAIAQWYYILRAISAAILLVILIYVGIRMALSNVGQEQAKYKKMFTDWVVSVALLFLLHYIIIFIIQVNEALVGAVAGVIDKDPIKRILEEVWVVVFWVGIEGIFAAIVYLVFIGQILSFFVLYVKRLITVGFLIMISPLICITYSIDKMGDGKAQALNNWLKEISYNILIQPFHCIIYVSFFNAIADIISNDAFAIGTYVLAIVVMQFMKKAEDILRKIFNFQAGSMSSLTESAQTLAAARGNVVKIGAGAATAFAGFKAAGGVKGLKESYADFKSSRQAKKDLRMYYDSAKEKGKADVAGKSFSEFKKSEAGKEKFAEYKQTNAKDMKARAELKRENKARKNYDKKHGREGAYDEMIKKNTVENAKKYIEEQKEQELSNQKASGEFDTKCEERAKKRMGDEKYNQLKTRAAAKKDGKPTKDAEVAQKELDDAKTAESHFVEKSIKQDVSKKLRKSGKVKDEAREKAVQESYKNKDTQSAVKQKINGVKQTYGEFSNSRFGKTFKAAASDSTKVASAIAIGAVAFGASGELNDTILAGQFGYGLAHGILDSSAKTITNDTSDTMRKYLEFTGSKPEDISKILNTVNFNSDGIPKMLSDSRKELVSELTKVMNDYVKNDFINELGRMLSTEGASIDIDQLLDNAGVSDENERSRLSSLTRTYADASLQMNLSQNIKQAQSIKMDVDTLSTKVETKVEKMDININFGRNGTINVEASGADTHSSQTVKDPNSTGPNANRLS